MATKNMVVLFDESGTPAISSDPRTDWFIGVGVTYEQSNENAIFSKVSANFGLTKSRPLKNNSIQKSRTVSIAKLLADLPVSIYVSSVDTANPVFRKTVIDYESFSTMARQEFRQARKRPIPQIIHSRILDHCLFNLITGYFETDRDDAAFSIFIDEWSIPKSDIDIFLRYRATSLYEKISKFFKDFTKGRLHSIAPLELLNGDSNRKRFIDVVASVFSRTYLKTDNPKYSCEASDILLKCERAHCNDATQHSIDIMQALMRPAGYPGR
jgi:hypothetical protein